MKNLKIFENFGLNKTSIKESSDYVVFLKTLDGKINFNKLLKLLEDKFKEDVMLGISGNKLIITNYSDWKIYCTPKNITSELFTFPIINTEIVGVDDEITETALFGPPDIADIKYVCKGQIKLHNEQIAAAKDTRSKEIYEARLDAFQMILDYAEGKKNEEE